MGLKMRLKEVDGNPSDIYPFGRTHIGYPKCVTPNKGNKLVDTHVHNLACYGALQTISSMIDADAVGALMRGME